MAAVIENYFFVGTTPLTSVLLDKMGTAFFGQSVLNSSGAAIEVKYTQDVLIASSTMISGTAFGLHFLPPETTPAPETTTTSSKLNNQGSIYSLSGTGVQFSGGGTSYVTNQGSIIAKKGIVIAASTNSDDKLDLFNSGNIIASEIAVVGGHGDDRIVNSGTIRTTGDVLMDLGEGNDIYDGSAGSALGLIKLGAGDDKAYGGTGGEIFSGGKGNDYIDGGAGSDTVDYSDAAFEGETETGIYVTLASTTQQSIGADQGGDILINIENLIGTTKRDTLIGSNGDNRLEGGDGNDLLEGGLGNDILKGGEGRDTVRYNGSSSVSIDLSKTGLQSTGGYGYDTLIDIENAEGGSGSDTLRGGDNDIANDLNGWNGNDSLSGGKGNDTLTGSDGNDSLEGGEGNDSLEGGNGIDTAVYTGFIGDYDFNVSAGTFTEETSYTVEHKSGGANGKDTLRGIRLLKFLGASGESDDKTYAITNSAPTNISLSGSGVKENSNKDVRVGSLSGTDADGDALTYTLVDDAGGLFKLDGTTIYVAKDGMLDYEARSSYTIRVKVSDGLLNLDGTPSGEFIKEIEIKLTNEYEDANVTRNGTAAGEQVVGEYGHDLVHGWDGDDSVFGRSGNDTLYGDDGNDYVIGGDGASGTALSGTGNDILYGGNGDDSLYGGDGTDVLYGGNGNDVLYGGAGNDSFVFDVKPNTKTNLDHIADFNPVFDTILLSRSIFTKIAKGGLSSKAFVVGNKVKDKYDRIIYVKDKGALFYDPDGTGKAKAVQFATIEKNLALTAKDFFII